MKVVDPRRYRTRPDQRRKPTFDHTVDKTPIPTRDNDSQRGRDTPPTVCGAQRLLRWENQPTATPEIPGVTVGVVDGAAQLRRGGRRGGVSTVRREYDGRRRAATGSFESLADCVQSVESGL